MIGLIGESLKHSYSKEIHEQISLEPYSLIELKREELDSFFKAANFNALNVTLPYKETVFKYMDEIDEAAKEIGAINTIINKNGRLNGYNTDAYGFKGLLMFHKINVRNKKVLILGSGGTSKTVKYVLLKSGAKEVYVVSRQPNKNMISYEQAKELFDINVIVNTTPVGMNSYKEQKHIIDLNDYPYLETVIDVIYNPFKTDLLIEAQKRGCKVAGGLFMLVAQAVRAQELIQDKKFPMSVKSRIYFDLILKHFNIVLVGMPSVGKSTAGRNLSKVFKNTFFDSDKEIYKQHKQKPGDIINDKGVEYFREIETNVIRQLATKTGVVISTGGGSILVEENVRNLLKTGYVIFLNRNIELLKKNKRAFATRPLLENETSFDKLYSERVAIYKKYSDFEYINNGSERNTLAALIKHFCR